MKMAMNFGMLRVVRQLMFLKLGYVNELNIIHERNSSNGGSTHFMTQCST